MNDYRPDTRTRDALMAELTAVAERTPIPHTHPVAGVRPTWDEAISSDSLSSGLLSAVIGRHVPLGDHLASLPFRFSVDFLKTFARLEALDEAPSSLVAQAIADPALVPVVVPAGAVLTGPKDGDRPARYVTTDSLTVTGATVSELGGYRYASDGDTSDRSDGTSPFSPFARPAPADHSLYIVSDLFAFEGQDQPLTATLEFIGGVHTDRLEDLEWSWTGANGPEVATPTMIDDTTVELRMQGGCVPTELDGSPRTFVEVAFPPEYWHPDTPSLSFTDVKITVTRNSIAPQAAFYNDGLIDTNKEFKPFGDAPRRGDAFYLRCDEALSKPLDSMTVWLRPLSTDEFGLVIVILMYWNPVTGELETYEDPYEPTVSWEVRTSTGWIDQRSYGSLSSATLPDTDERPLDDSIETKIGGQTGYFVRAFLRAGDFGWSRYLDNIGAFAAQAAGGGTPSGDLLKPPAPPMLESVSITYQSRTTSAAAFYRRSGLAFTELGSGSKQPFASPDIGSLHDPRAAVYIGLETPDTTLGSTMSIYFDLDASSSCDFVSERLPGRWQAWTGAGWDDLSVADATSGLRVSGLLQFVMPTDWAVGSPDVDRPDGRWIRYLTDQPELVATILSVVPDAVEARYQPVTDMAPPPAGSVKGPANRIEGVKKLVSATVARPHRFEESDAVFASRAPQVLRHRNRAVLPDDYEMLVRSGFPEVGLVACKPHHGPDGAIEPGTVGLVVIPDDPGHAPLPSADLALRIETMLTPVAPLHARVVVLCPAYRAVTVDASILLRADVPALDARVRITKTIDDFLHPRHRTADDFGRALYPSTLVDLLEAHEDVDRVLRFEIAGAAGESRIVPPDPDVGLVVSSGSHQLTLEEQIA